MIFQPPTSNAETTKATKKSKAAKSPVSQRVVFVVLGAFTVFAGFVVPAVAQQLLDHVVARVGTSAITQTDVDAAVTFGIVNRGDAVKQLIDRRLMLAEVDRFPPPEPGATEIKLLMETMRAKAGADTAAAMKRTGVNDDRLAELARDTLRIQSYMQQRFGSGPRAEEQRTRWLTEIRARGDVTVMPPQP
jgi:hypothetical protein